MFELYYKTKRSNLLVLLLTILLQSAFIIMNNDTMGGYVMLCITIIVLFFVLFNKNIHKIIYFEKFHKGVFLFGLYCMVTSLWAIDYDASLTKSITIFEILICMSVLYTYYSYDDNIDNLLLTIVWTGSIIAIYSLYYYGYTFIVNTALLGERLENDFANINAVAMKCSLSIVIALYFFLYKKKLYPLAISSVSIIIIAASGSRKAFVMLVIGVVMLFLLKSSSKSLMKTMIKGVVLCLILFIGLKMLQDVALFSTINERMEGLIALVTGEGVVDSSSDKRALYIQEGIDQWYKTPILGIGIANSYLFNSSQTYTHNNYVELLSCGGVVGFLFYYSIYFYLIKNIWNNRSLDKTRAMLMLLIIGITLVTDYGSVSYYSKSTYFTLMVMFLYVRVLKGKLIK